MKTKMLALLFLLVGCGGTSHPPLPTQPSVIFFGDSIFGAWNLETYFPGKEYVNGGMFGYRTDQLKAVLPDVLSGKVCHGLDGDATFPLSCVLVTPPKTIVILAGWNNLLQGNSVNPIDDLQSMVAMASAKGIRVIICTVYAYDPAHPAPWMAPTGAAPVTFYDMWRNPLNDSIGQMHGVTFVDFSDLFDRQSDYTIDGIHPNDSGYAQMRDLINRGL
jgi:lysophospholipase L1-like esterase